MSEILGAIQSMMFTKSFTQQEPIPEPAIEAAVSVLRNGRLHRYNTAADEAGEVALFEREYAAWQGTRFCLATASGGTALQIALRVLGLASGAPVLTNAFTLAPVPGAIVAVGAIPVLVESTASLTIDLADLEAKARGSGARVLLLSHMRGHLADMDALDAITHRYGITLIEDCAHTMGASWNGRRSGNFGLAGCFSTQTYKHMNSGEGGIICSDDEAFMARAIILSGSYMLYRTHIAAPADEAFADARLDMPNCSARMDNLRAAILRPQLALLEDNIGRWNERHAAIACRLAAEPGLDVPQAPVAARQVGSSIQFLLPQWPAERVRAFLAACRARGVQLKWFGALEPDAYTSRHESWRYLEARSLPQTAGVLSRLIDMRIPLTFTLDDCIVIAGIIVEEFRAIRDGAKAANGACA